MTGWIHWQAAAGQETERDYVAIDQTIKSSFRPHFSCSTNLANRVPYRCPSRYAIAFHPLIIFIHIERSKK
jgi:hypothetical protein